MHRFKIYIYFLFSVCKMVDIRRETWKRNGAEVMYIEKRLGHANLPTVTLQYPSKYENQRQELQNCGNYQHCRRFLKENFAKQIIMDCRTTPAVNFRTKLGFKQHDPIMTREQSVLTKTMTVFAAEEIILQYNVLGYRVDAYFPKHKLGIEIDEQGHNRDINYDIERQKAIERDLGCKFIMIDPSKKDFDVNIELGRIQKYIVKSTKKLSEKSLIDDLSKRLLGLGFKSNNAIKTKCLKISLSTFCLHYKDDNLFFISQKTH